MEDSLSVKSNESIATSEEFDFVCDKPSVSKTPTLDIVDGDINELKNVLTEVLQEPDQYDATMDRVIVEETRKVGQSMFYDTTTTTTTVERVATEAGTSPSEKTDAMKPDYSSDEDEVSDVDQDCTIFSGVTYLGAATINAPKSEGEIQRNMTALNEQTTEQGIKVAVSVPCSSQGVVVLYDAATHSVMTRYEIHRILFYARGAADGQEASCFAFTWSHGDTQESAIFQCHVFRCDISEAVTRVSACFSKAFQRVPRSMSASVNSEMSGSIATASEPKNLMYVFEVSLEIKEDDGRGVFTTVAKDRNGFKLRVNLEKQLCLTIRQVSDSGPQLSIERCFGVLVVAGRHVRHSDMRLLEIVQTGPDNSIISANWDPTESAFESLNVETARDARPYITVAVDLVIRGIQEPVRFQIETPVKVFSQSEKFWYFQKRSLIQQFYLNLREMPGGNDLSDVRYEVHSIETSGELDRNRLNLTLNLSSFINSPSIDTPKEEYHSDGDEPLLSGTGQVSKDCSVDVLESWADVLQRWKSTQQRPRQLACLVRHGIPEALRGEVWQRLANTEENNTVMDTYRILITKESSCENVIQRDIARTFPAHDFFKEAGGLGQDSLYRVSKAYAVYDGEVGYCQGLSFLAATLLLHMPEEQAFCVLVKLMYDYQLRDLYKDGFDHLYLRLYQLNRLMEEQLGNLWEHFRDHRIETHMFASQWFLTLFTARFPLYLVFHIIDIFLLQGIETLFQVALALLMTCKKDLLLLDFEGILKYFRVSLPKKFRTEDSVKQLLKLACSIKVKKLKKYEHDFNAVNEAADNSGEVDQLRLTITRMDEERKLHCDEISQLKEMLKREVAKADADSKRNDAIISDYKQICQRLDREHCDVKGELNAIKVLLSSCDKCRSLCIEKECKGGSDGGVAGFAGESDDKPESEKNRIRELELELAQTKLAQVEAECKNQDLTHQLHATLLELNSTKNSWLSKTLTSIKEAANKKDLPHLSYSSLSNSHQNATPTFISHVNAARRDSAPLKDTHRDVAVHKILKDSQSCSNLRTQN